MSSKGIRLEMLCFQNLKKSYFLRIEFANLRQLGSVFQFNRLGGQGERDLLALRGESRNIGRLGFHLSPENQYIQYLRQV